MPYSATHVRVYDSCSYEGPNVPNFSMNQTLATPRPFGNESVPMCEGRRRALRYRTKLFPPERYGSTTLTSASNVMLMNLNTSLAFLNSVRWWLMLDASARGGVGSVTRLTVREQVGDLISEYARILSTNAVNSPIGSSCR